MMFGCISYLLRLFAVGFCTQSVWSGNCIPPGSYKLVFKPCIKDRPYRLIPNVSFSDCVRSCMLRSRCQSVMYWDLAIVCGLVDVDDIMNFVTTTGTRSICTYASVVSLDRSILGACENHTCADTQTCTVNSSGSGYTCVFSECPPAPEVNNAKVVTKFQEIKGRVRYDCKPGVRIEGKRIRLCRENATWSEMDGGCGVTCREPKKEIETAYMTNVVGEKWRQSTVVMFKCKPEYVSDQTLFNFSCTQHSSWSSGGRVPCCKPGWTIIRGRCWQYFNGSGFTNKTDMHLFCAQQNSSLMVRDSLDRLLYLKQHLLEPKSVTQTIINQPSVGVFDDKIQDIKKCIKETNGIVIPDNVTTYADVIAFGQQHNPKSCLHIDMWAPGQPATNSTSDTCTAYGYATGYRMITVSCMWDNPGEYGFVCEAEHVI